MKPPETLEPRVVALEQRMTTLEQMPMRVDALTLQVSQSRTEMHDEFSAVRSEMQRDFAAVRSEMQGEFAAVRSEVRDVGTQMLVLHEDVISRIALLAEGSSGRRGPGRKRKR